MLPPGSEMTNTKTSLPIYSQSHWPKAAVGFVFFQVSSLNLVHTAFLIAPVTLYRGAGVKNEREGLLSLSLTLSMQYTRPLCCGLFQKQGLVEPSIPAAVWPLLTTGCRSCTEFAKAQDQGLPNLLCLDYFREPAALFQFGLAVGTPSSF